MVKKLSDKFSKRDLGLCVKVWQRELVDSIADDAIRHRCANEKVIIRGEILHATQNQSAQNKLQLPFCWQN